MSYRRYCPICGQICLSDDVYSVLCVDCLEEKRSEYGFFICSQEDISETG